jgi:hypothetical protein
MGYGKVNENEGPLQPPEATAKRSEKDVPKATPETPVGSRVPFAELIGNNEDPMDQKPQLTPVERVLWNQSPPSIDYASELMTPMFKRGTKRGRSSSPQSSSREEAAACFVSPGKRRSFDLNTLQKSLKTPVVDPAGDLWTRYSINTHEKPTPSKPASQPLHDLLNSSSPPTPARFRRVTDSGGLRRTMSCTTEWPTSIAKRRRIEKSHTQVLDKSPHTGSDELTRLQRDQRTSKVSFLLEMIHDGLRDESRVPKEDESSSSSPLALNNRTNGHITSRSFHGQPVLNKNPVAEVSLHNFQDLSAQELPSSANSLVVEAGPALKTLSSDYGDDGVSQSFFSEMAASIQGIDPNISALHHEALAPERSNEQVAQMQDPSNKPFNRSPVRALGEETPLVVQSFAIPLEPLRAQENVSEVPRNEEDFDYDDDDEFFAADLEDMVALYDQRSPPEKVSTPAEVHPGHLGASPSTITAARTSENTKENVLSERNYVEVSDDEDEFGGANELEELAFEMDLATQSAGAQTSHVRTDLFWPSR